MVVSELSAVAFVPSQTAPVLKLLQKLGLDRGKLFLDLGSGDGRMVIAACLKFGCRGVGIEINPLLIIWSKLRTKRQGATNAEFVWGSFWKQDWGRADYIYCYLSPKAMPKVASKFLREGKGGAILISKAFVANLLKKYLIGQIVTNGRKMFVYQKIPHCTS